MSTKTEDKKEEKIETPSSDGQAVAVATPGSLVADDIAGELAGLEGLGYSEDVADSLIPILGLLQDNSAEVKKQHAKRIDGADAGMLIIRSLRKIFESGQVLVQPCAFSHTWVEWQGDPGEGMPVMQYLFHERPEDAQEVPDPQNPDRMFWRRPNGNRLVETRNHFCRMFMDDGSRLEIVIPMAGTNHRASRQWTAQMKQFGIPGSQIKAPAWFRLYRISTEYNSRGQQSWFTYSIGDLGWIAEKADRDAGRALFESVQRMDVRPDLESEAVDVTPGPSGNPDREPGGAVVDDDDIPF